MTTQAWQRRLTVMEIQHWENCILAGDVDWQALPDAVLNSILWLLRGRMADVVARMDTRQRQALFARLWPDT